MDDPILKALALVIALVLGGGSVVGAQRLRNGRGTTVHPDTTEPVAVTVVDDSSRLDPRKTKTGSWDIDKLWGEQRRLRDRLQHAETDVALVHGIAQDTQTAVTKIAEQQSAMRADVAVLIGEARATREDVKELRGDVRDVGERLARMGG